VKPKFDEIFEVNVTKVRKGRSSKRKTGIDVNLHDESSFASGREGRINVFLASSFFFSVDQMPKEGDKIPLLHVIA